jgi:NAD(P)-dependent dehydrogenase (short-subunit alcohol dehydrogenase family)
LEGRVALVTGASRGIGAAVAKRYGAEGGTVVAVARTVGGLEEVDDAIHAVGASATLVPLDLRDGPGIDRLGGLIAERHGRLDVLVGNAAVLGRLGPLGHCPPEMWEEVLAINVTANWRLIRAFDALLRAATAGRAMFVTSGVSRMTLPYWGPYATSKAALDMLVKTYAAEVANTKVRVNIVDPGVVRTGMRASAMPGEDPMSLPTPEAITDVFVDLAAPDLERNGEIVGA